MSSTWLIIALVALAVAGMLLVLYRKNQADKSVVHRDPESNASRNYAQDREDARLAHMSEEDRVWEAAILQRQQANSERGDPLAEQRT